MTRPRVLIMIRAQHTHWGDPHTWGLPTRPTRWGLLSGPAASLRRMACLGVVSDLADDVVSERLMEVGPDAVSSRPGWSVLPKTHAVQAIAFVLLAVLLPLAEVAALFTGAASQHWTYTVFIDVALTVYSGARLATFLGGARPSYLGVVFFIFVYVWMGLAAVAQTASQTWPFGDVLSPDIQLQGALVVATGTVLYDAGRLLSRLLHRERQAVVPHRIRQLSTSRSVILGWIVIITSPLAVYSLGGLAAQFQNRDAADAALFPAGVINGVAQQQILLGSLARDGWTVVAFVALYALLLVRRERRIAGLPAKVSHRLLLFGLLGANVVINSPFANARFWLGTMLIALLLARPFSLRWLGKVTFLVCMLVGTAVIFPYGNIFRNAASYQSTQDISVVRAFQTLPDYDASFEVAATVQYVEVNGLSMGRQLLGTATFWVPRHYWPTKPEDTGLVLGYFYGTPTPNISAPIWAEGFIDFGWLGVAVIMMLVGYGSATLDRGWGAKVGPLEFSRVVLPLLAGYSFILLRGSLLQAMGRLTVFCLLLWLLCRRTDIFVVTFTGDKVTDLQAYDKVNRPGIDGGSIAWRRRSHGTDQEPSTSVSG